jgi:predicted nucleic acid-binding protein
LARLVITAVDTNIVLDVMLPAASHHQESEHALNQAVAAGPRVISESVYAELASRFPQRRELEQFLADLALRFEPSTPDTLHAAGIAWGVYARRRPTTLQCPQCGALQPEQCAQCGGSVQARQHVLADFIIGAHALHQADRLVTRDRRYYRTYFPTLALS